LTTIHPPFASCHSLSVCAVTAKIKIRPDINPHGDIYIIIIYIRVSNSDNGFQRISSSFYLIDYLKPHILRLFPVFYLFARPPCIYYSPKSSRLPGARPAHEGCPEGLKHSFKRVNYSTSLGVFLCEANEGYWSSRSSWSGSVWRCLMPSTAA